MADLVPSGATVLLDNFAGSGTIVGRTPEVSFAGNWAGGSYGDVTGGRLVRPAIDEYIQAALGTVTPFTTSGGWQLDVEFFVPTLTVFSTVNYQTVAQFSMSAQDGFALGTIEVELIYYDPGTHVAPNGFVFEVQATRGTHPSYTQLFPLLSSKVGMIAELIPGTTHRLTVSLSVAGRFQILIDGVGEVDEDADPTDVLELATTPGRSFYVQSLAGPRLSTGFVQPMEFDAIRMDGLPEIGPPPAFWTNFIGTYETV